ncbi:MAG: energy transducer TonB, partial [Terriglobales bacterium]
YCVVLTTPAADLNSFFWYRWAQQPPSPIAYRKLGEDTWRFSHAFGAMLRVDADSIVAPGEAPQPPLSAPLPLVEPSLPAGVYRVGTGITPSRANAAPDPAYTDAARKDRVQGVVVLWVIVGADGSVRDAGIARSLRPDLDESALHTVRGWRFQPATKDGQPVPVLIHVEVNFRLG